MRLISKNNLINIYGGDSGDLIIIQDLQKDIICSLKAPVFEINTEQCGGSEISYYEVVSKRIMANNGIEYILSYKFNIHSNLFLHVYLRIFPESPFIRFKYVLKCHDYAVLTKNKGKDSISYTELIIEDSNIKKLTEIQFGHFDTILHCYLPCMDAKSEDELSEGCSYPGPITIIECIKDNIEYCCSLAYEHGAEYPDTYINFSASKNQKILNVNIQSTKGNYYSGQAVDYMNVFESVWFHFALNIGSRTELFKQYRNFFLKYISENVESRKPYIYYNTWNYQERNRYFNNKYYLDSMRLEHIMKEIDIAHEIGVDVFVIDTGWYNKTGDWLVNTNFFPDGLKEIKRKLDSYGMKLGLWLNPIVAAKTSKVYLNNPECVITKDYKESFWGKIWETEESYGMCLISRYAEYFVEKLIELNKELGVTYLKWDAVGQYDCNSPLHNHGTRDNTPQERLECYSYGIGLALIKIVEELTKRCPELIVDFDVTEGGRFMGLGFLSVGRFFLINNGPYFSDFDMPSNIKIEPNTINVFFHTGTARSKICRQSIKYDFLVPSNLFLTHFYPDKPQLSQMSALCSMMLAGNGIWGDLISLDKEDVELLKNTINKYKQVSRYVNDSYPRIKGFIGSSPEIYEKIDYTECKGLICFFTKSGGRFEYITSKIDTSKTYNIDGADYYEITPEGRLKIIVRLQDNEARPVFIFSHKGCIFSA